MNSQTIEELYEEHLRQEPYKGKFLKEVNILLEDMNHIKWRLEAEKLKRLCEIPKEKREEILHFLKTSGKTVGETGANFQIDSMVVSDLLYYNISPVYLLNTTSI